MFKCEICGREFETIFGLSCHIRKHKISREEYYLKYLGEKGKCAECGKDTNFLTIVVGYCKFCSKKCSNNSDETKNKMKETCMKNNKCEYAMQSEKVRAKSKDTNLQRYGFENAMQNKEIKNKSIKTCIKKYGVDNYSKSIEYKKNSKLRNINKRYHSKLNYKKVQERYPDLVNYEELISGPNGEILGHCKNSKCKNSKENGGYFELETGQIYERQRGINGVSGNDVNNFYCCEECKHTCLLFGKSAAALNNLLTENTEILYTQSEYSTWKEEVYYRQREENNTEVNFCEYCHASENLHIHHEVPQKIVPGYALDPDNGIIACEKCHYEKGHKIGTECSTGNLANKICK